MYIVKFPSTAGGNDIMTLQPNINSGGTMYIVTANSYGDVNAKQY